MSKEYREARPEMTHVRQKAAKPRSTQMKLTATARKVLVAISTLPSGSGANFIAKAAGIFCGKTTSIRGGQYAGKLIRAGWLHREDEWYRGARGHDIWMGVRYTLTDKGRVAIKASRPEAAGSVPSGLKRSDVKGVSSLNPLSPQPTEHVEEEKISGESGTAKDQDLEEKDAG